jgi:acetate kinase
MTPAIGGLDLLVFTGGVGEHSRQVRASVADALSYLGVGLDRAVNERAMGDADITGPGAATRTVVITARQDLEIRRQVVAILEGRAGAPSTG